MKVLTLQNLLAMILADSEKPYILVEPSFTSPAILGFVGSRNLQDFRQNIKVTPQEWPPNDPHGTVHSGFASKLKTLLKNYKEIREFTDEYDDIILTGHSLGGAISTLFASQLVSEQTKIKSVHTFGAPPVSSQEFKQYYKTQGLYSTTFRYTTPRDPVTNLIPFYNHLGNKILLPYNDKSRLKHHDMETYKKLIKKMDMEEWILFP